MHSDAALQANVHAFDPTLPLEHASAPPSSWYVDNAVHELEQRTVFAHNWVFACRAAQVAEPGQYVTGRHGARPWIVLRDEQGTLRAFHNVCRHRGAEVLQGCGRAEQLVCRYHAWRYGLDGALRSAPRIGAIRDFDRAAFSLPPLSVEAWGPFVFINGDADAAQAAPLAPRLDELDRRLDATGWQQLRWVARRSYDVGCNWKAFNDNYLDGGYHIAHVHQSLDAQLDLDSYRTELFDGWSLQSSAAARAADPRAQVDVAARIGGGALYAWLYPTFMLNRYGPALDTNIVVPVAPDRCRVHFDFFFDADVVDDPSRADFIAESLAQSHATQLEDIDISESVQVGTASPTFDRGRYAPRYEAAIHQFHGLLAADLRRGLHPEPALVRPTHG